MSQHGYLHEYDEGWDRGDDRDRAWTDRDRNFMLGNRDDDRWSDRGRGTSGYGREHGYGGFQGDYSRSGGEQGGFGGRGDWERAPRSFSSHQDDHYRSWRDKQMEALDRDYADYCREREEKFHEDFDNWRRDRQASRGEGSGEQDELLLSNAATIGESEPEITTTDRGRR